MPIETSGELKPIEGEKVEPEENKDYQRGISQDNLEDLRSEYNPIGVLLDELPEPSEVRDWTMVAIPSKDASGIDTINLFLMVDGKWFNLNDYQEKETGAHAGVDQFDTASVITFTGVNDITIITDDWVLSDAHHIGYDGAGVFTIEKAGHYFIGWSLSFASSGNNKDYEMGILKNGVNIQQGWAHRKIGASTDLGDMSSLTILELRGGDKISLGMLNETDTQTAIIDHAGFTIFRIR